MYLEDLCAATTGQTVEPAATGIAPKDRAIHNADVGHKPHGHLAYIWEEQQIRAGELVQRAGARLSLHSLLQITSA